VSILGVAAFAGGPERVCPRVLQPLQLTDVSLRYAEEIVELRDFLVKAGCEVRTEQALGQIADRLTRDRAFHRDLTSYIWVVIDRRDRTSYSDLLGVLAVAAAGSSFAATADEDVAHRLLRFLMEARHSLDGLSDHENQPPARGIAAAVATPSIEPLQPPRRNVEPLHSEERELFSPVEQESSDSEPRALPWMIAAAACVLVVVFFGLWLKHRPAEYAGNHPPVVTPQANVASAPVPNDVVTPSASRPVEREAAPVAHSTPRRNSRAMRSRTASRSSRRTPEAAPYIPSPAAYAPPTATASATHVPAPAEAQPAPITRPAPPPPAIRAGTATPAPASAPTVARGGASAPPSVTQQSPQQGGSSVARTSKAPIQLRRRTPGSAPSDDVSDVAAAEIPSGISGASGPSSKGSAGTARGTVHATSLGVMASNLVYSPMPAYPAAASASHVTGEVKVSANVDRDGKVASVRVISGPPMLRDAALDAVQRWRYRPYLSGDGPVPMSAIEVLDFQLP
jgi:TonB family protein